METGLIFQERQGCHISEDDYSQSLFMALQEQENNVHGQVSCTRVRNIVHGQVSCTQELTAIVTNITDYCSKCIFHNLQVNL